MNKKKIFIICLVVALIITLQVWGVYTLYDEFRRDDIGEWSQKVEAIYNNNKDIFNNFVDACYEYEISYIHIQKNDRPSDNLKETRIKGYWVYSYGELEQTAKDDLKVFLTFLKEHRARNISVNGQEKNVSISLGRSFSTIVLHQVAHNLTISEIKEDASYIREAWYIDENWYIEIPR